MEWGRESALEEPQGTPGNPRELLWLASKIRLCCGPRLHQPRGVSKQGNLILTLTRKSSWLLGIDYFLMALLLQASPTVRYSRELLGQGPAHTL